MHNIISFLQDFQDDDFNNWQISRNCQSIAYMISLMERKQSENSKYILKIHILANMFSYCQISQSLSKRVKFFRHLIMWQPI